MTICTTLQPLKAGKFPGIVFRKSNRSVMCFKTYASDPRVPQALRFIWTHGRVCILDFSLQLQNIVTTDKRHFCKGRVRARSCFLHRSPKIIESETPLSDQINPNVYLIKRKMLSVSPTVPTVVFISF